MFNHNWVTFWPPSAWLILSFRRLTHGDSRSILTRTWGVYSKSIIRSAVSKGFFLVCLPDRLYFQKPSCTFINIAVFCTLNVTAISDVVPSDISRNYRQYLIKCFFLLLLLLVLNSQQDISHISTAMMSLSYLYMHIIMGIFLLISLSWNLSLMNVSVLRDWQLRLIFFTLISGINIDYFLAHFTCGKLMDFRYSLATNIFKISSQSCLLFSIILFLWPYCKAFLLVFFNFMWTVYRLVWSTIIKINQS